MILLREERELGIIFCHKNTCMMRVLKEYLILILKTSEKAEKVIRKKENILRKRPADNVKQIKRMYIELLNLNTFHSEMIFGNCKGKKANDKLKS